MKTKIEEVKSERAVVAKVEIPIYETLAEAIEALGEAKCLELIVTQNGTNIKNAARAAATQGPSKTQLQSEALTIVATTKTDELKACNGDSVKIKALIDATVDQLEKDYEAKRKALRDQLGGEDVSEANADGK